MKANLRKCCTSVKDKRGKVSTPRLHLITNNSQIPNNEKTYQFVQKNPPQSYPKISVFPDNGKTLCTPSFVHEHASNEYASNIAIIKSENIE